MARFYHLLLSRVIANISLSSFITLNSSSEVSSASVSSASGQHLQGQRLDTDQGSLGLTRAASQKGEDVQGLILLIACKPVRGNNKLTK